MSKIYVDEILPKDNATVDGSKLSAVPASAISALNSSALPTGTIIQHLVDVYTTEVSSTSLNSFITTNEIAITPSSTTSKLYILAVANGLDNGGEGRIEGRIKYDTSSGGTGGTTHSYFQVSKNSGGTNGIQSGTLVGYYTPGTTNTQYIKFMFQKHDTASSTWYVNRYTANFTTLTVMEIAG